MKEFAKMYPGDKDFIDSTAAARVNGYLAGYGTYEGLLAEIGSLGLTPEGNKKLLGMSYASHR